MILRFFILLFLSASSLSAYTIKTLSEMPRIYLIENFLSDEDCDHIIKKAKPSLKRSKVLSHDGSRVVSPRRTSCGMWFPALPKDKLLKEIEKRIEELTEIPRENGEAFQVLHYQVRGEFKPHHDYFTTNSTWNRYSGRGGQRIATCIIYLHDTPEGGATIFPRAGVEVKPIKGQVLMFYNCLPNGMEDPLSFHGGAPVIKGEKWIMTKWLHERKFN